MASKRRRSKISDTQPKQTVSEKTRRISRGKRILFPLLAAMLSLLAATMVAEIAMRLFNIRPERYEKKRNLVMTNGRFEDHGYTALGRIKNDSPFRDQGVEMGEYVPGAVFKTVYDTNPRGYFAEDNSVLNRINSLGFRGPEIPLAKPPGVFRILGLGDSFTFGTGVRDEDTFLRRMESSLNAGGSGTNYQVINAGIEGFNTRDEVIYLENRWLQLKPDLILITFYLNDAYSEAAFANQGEELGIYLQPATGLAKASYAWDFFQHRIQRRRESQKVQEHYNNAFFLNPRDTLEQPGKFKMDWGDSRNALARAAALARSREIHLALAIFPELYRLNDKYPFSAVHQLVRETCKEFSIPVIDLLDAFKGQKAEALWVHPSDHHPNEIAHGIAAKAIEAFLRESQLLKPKAP